MEPPSNPAKRAFTTAPNTFKMHPRNLHSKPIDFDEMAKKDKRFKPFAKPMDVRGSTGRTLKQEFTRALLSIAYNLNVEFPVNQLCPAVPSRANYIHHLHDVLHEEPVQSDCKIRGIDIGVGASCIYPLLGAAIYGWAFVATDICNLMSAELARENVARNGNQERIDVRVVDHGTMLCGNIAADELFDFCMCNPPFFDMDEEVEGNPRTVCTATAESVVLQTQVRWYSSLLGKKATIKTVKQLWSECGITNTRIIELLQGKTTRWVVAWSFTEEGIAARTAQAAKRARISGRVTVKTKDASVVYNACKDALTRAKMQVQSEALRFQLQVADPDTGVAFEVHMLQPRNGVLLVELKAKSDMRQRAEEVWGDVIEPALALFEQSH